MVRIAITALLTTAAVLALAGCNTDQTADMTRKQQLQAALEKRYENPQAHYELGKIYHREGNLLRAEFHYNVAMGFDPAMRVAQAALVRAYQDGRNAEKARTAAQMYIQQASVSADASMALGRAFQREGLDEYALQAYTQAQNIDPNDPLIPKQLGYFHLRKGDRVRAESFLRRSFELNPDQPDVASELGRMGVQVQVPPRKAVDVMRISELTGRETVDPTIK